MSTTILRNKEAGRPGNGGLFASHEHSEPECASLPTEAAPECVECGRDAEKMGELCAECQAELHCRDCGERNDNGEGYDGYCGNCADKRTCPHCFAGLDDDGQCEDECDGEEEEDD